MVRGLVGVGHFHLHLETVVHSRLHVELPKKYQELLACWRGSWRVPLLAAKRALLWYLPPVPEADHHFLQTSSVGALDAQAVDVSDIEDDSLLFDHRRAL